MGKKLVMAQKRGETRALCLGVAMVVCAVIAYYILGTTVLPLYQKRCAPPSLQPLPEGLVCEEPLTSSCPSPGPPRQAGILFLRVEDSNAGRVEGRPDWPLLVWNSRTWR